MKYLRSLLRNISRKKAKTSKLQILVVVLFAVFICCFLISKQKDYNEDLFTDQLQPDVGKQACVHPRLDPWEKNMMKHFYTVPMPECSAEEDWIEVGNGSAWITPRALSQHGSITCKIAFISRGDNDETINFEPFTKLTGNKPLKLKSDFFRADCISEKDGGSYKNVHAGIAYKNELHEQFTDEKKKPELSVLMIGFDSISHMTYIRKMPKTLKYFNDELEGFILNGYNIVGDGTPQAFIPILTGKTELELPRTLKRSAHKQFVDIYPMIWKHFKDHGYITSFNEDMPSIGMFNYRMNGFNKQPTDHFMRPFFLADESDPSNLCIGSKRKSEVFLNYIRQTFDMYPSKSKFAISFFCSISHEDPNVVGTGDSDLVSLLKHLNDSGHLNSTVLILMSDHGARFHKLRAELQGKHEERMPFFAFAFPPWFKHRYPTAYKNFHSNTERLTTPFDIHATLKSILNNFEENIEIRNSRELSLFTEIPKSRTCGEAGIPMHWCACLNWHALCTTDINVNESTMYVVDHINEYIGEEKKCVKLSLHNITRAVQFLPDRSLLKFLESSDADGRITDMTDNTAIDKVIYQITFYTAPNMGHFEVTVTHDLKSSSQSFMVDINDVSRINAYGHDADCVRASSHDVRKFCYCKT